MPAIAHHDAAPQITPYVPVEPHIAKQWRLYYMATIAWMDSQLGRVLDELETLGHHDDTLVGKIVILSRFACCPSLANPKTITISVLHADHGWSLGEHGDCECRTGRLGLCTVANSEGRPLLHRAEVHELGAGRPSTAHHLRPVAAR